MEVFLDEEQCNELTATLLFQCNISTELDLPHVTAEKLLAYVNKFNVSTLVSYLVHNFSLLRSFCAIGLPLEGKNYNILIYSIIADKENIFNLMLELGANVNAVLDGDFTPLHFAALYNRSDFMQELMSAGADSNAISKKGKTALGIAIRRKNTSQILMCCTHGATVTREMCDAASGDIVDFLTNVRRAQKIKRSTGIDMIPDIISRYEEES
jgi:hypothetical protein